jgi:hypothetical protein
VAGSEDIVNAVLELNEKSEEVVLAISEASEKLEEVKQRIIENSSASVSDAPGELVAALDRAKDKLGDVLGELKTSQEKGEEWKQGV